MSGKNTIITSTHTGDNTTRLTYPTVGEALHIARQLAHYSPLNVDTTLTDEMLEDHSNDTWFDALGIQTMKDYRPEDVWARKKGTDMSLRIPMGLKVDSVTYKPTGELVYVNLADTSSGDPDASGPHGVCSGTTGSGKSVFINSLFMSLCYYYSPELINFILIDFKGGLTFLGAEKLPHVVGNISNLAASADEMDRLEDILLGELVKRETILGNAGVGNVKDYRERRVGNEATMPPLPYLIILGDEYGQLKDSTNSHLKKVLGKIGREGRALGMFTFSASQSLNSSVLGEDLWGQHTWAISLKVGNTADSMAMLDTTQAVNLPQRGYGIVKHVQNSMAVTEFVKTFFSEQRFVEPDEQEKTTYVVAPDGTPIVTWFNIDAQVDESETEDSSLPEEKSASTPQPGEKMNELLKRRLSEVDPKDYQVRAMWQQSLNVPFTLNQIGVVEGEDGMPGASVGVIDAPKEHQLNNLLLQFGGATPHYYIVGNPGSGKTTGLISTIAMLDVTMQDKAHAFVINYDDPGSPLSMVADFPSVVGYASKRNKDMMERVIGEIMSVLDSRISTIGAVPGIESLSDYYDKRPVDTDRYRTLIVCFDGMGELAKSEEGMDLFSPGLARNMRHLLEQGPSVGIHVVATSKPGELSAPLFRNMVTSPSLICLEGSTEVEGVTQHMREGLRKMPVGRPGRCVLQDGNSYSFGRFATPWADTSPIPPARVKDGVKFYSPTFDFKPAISQLAGFLQNMDVPRIEPVQPVLATINYRVMSNLISGLNSEKPVMGVGFSTETTRLIALPETSPHFMCGGEQQSGKTMMVRTILGNILSQYSPEEAQVFLIDPKMGLLGERDLLRQYGFIPEGGYATTPEQTETLLKRFNALVETRKPGNPDSLTAHDIATHSWWEGPELFLIIDDMMLVHPQNSFGMEGSPWGVLANLLKSDIGYGMHVMVTCSAGELADKIIAGNPGTLGEALTSKNSPVLLLSGVADRQKIISGVGFEKMRPGKGKLVLPQSEELFIVQTPFSEPWVTPEGE